MRGVFLPAFYPRSILQAKDLEHPMSRISRSSKIVVIKVLLL